MTGDAPRARIVRPEDAPHAPGRPTGFTGGTQVHRLAEALGTEQVMVNVLYFEAGHRSRPHVHPHDQVLYFEGAGVVAVGGGPDQPVEPGSFVLLPGNVVHMHGASDAGPAWHISVTPVPTTTDWEMDVPPAWRRWMLQEP
jgi:quercetin dioxygenase-like cupin family protein